MVQRDEFKGLVADRAPTFLDPHYLWNTTYTYDAAGRLIETSVIENPVDLLSVEGDKTHSYAYSIAGDRVRVKSHNLNNGAQSDQRMLIDTQNPTGYSQVLLVAAGTAKTFYTLGLDVINQRASGFARTEDLLYDPHGSTRALISTNPGTGAPDISNGYFWTYDAYGNTIESVNIESTNLRFSGEWTDATGTQHLRARGYEPLTGTFLTSDPFSGDISNPQSLHKYLYAHADPVNGVDPTGMIFGAAGVGVSSSISTSLRVAATATAGAALAGLGGATIGAATSTYLHVLTTQSFEGIGTAAWDGAKSGAIWGAVIGASSIHPALLATALGGSLAYNAVQTISAISDANLPSRTKIALTALLLLQGTLARVPIQRGIASIVDPVYAANSAARVHYLSEVNQLASLQGALRTSAAVSIETIARLSVQIRNSLKPISRSLMTKEDVARLEARNMSKYGNPVGPTAEQQFRLYGSWERVIEATLRTNQFLNDTYGPGPKIMIPFPGIEDE